MSAENKAVVRSFFEIEDREYRIPLELCAPGFKAHLPGAPPLDLDAFVQQEENFFRAFSDIQHLIEDLVAEDDRVAIRMTWKGTHTGDFMGLPASNVTASVTAMGMMRVTDGKVSEFWGVPDALSLMQQIGAIPAPEPAAD